MVPLINARFFLTAAAVRASRALDRAYDRRRLFRVERKMAG